MKGFYVVIFPDEKWVKTFTRKVNATRFAREFGGKVAYGKQSTGFVDVSF